MHEGLRTRDWINQAIMIIESDVRQHFTIREIALKVGTNSFSLKQGFKDAFGMGPYEYLQEKRLEKAIELLVQTDHPIKAICRQVGYRSSSSFIVVFKKKYGITPLVWRRKENMSKEN